MPKAGFSNHAQPRLPIHTNRRDFLVPYWYAWESSTGLSWV